MDGGEGTSAGEAVACRVALYSLARLASGLREVEVTPPSLVGEGEVASALALACPVLVGRALQDDGAELQERYLPHSKLREPNLLDIVGAEVVAPSQSRSVTLITN